MHDGDVRADGLGDGVELLVGGHDADHAVTRGDERAEHVIICARRTVRRDDLVWLEALIKPCNVKLYSDSQYLCNAFNQHWIEGWIKKGWKRGKNEPVKNRDLWERLLTAKAPHNVEFLWVKGHAGNPGNERCDMLATAAADGDGKITDEGLDQA